MANSEQTGGQADQAGEFVALILRHRHALYAFIAKQLFNPADVEDVFQKTSMILWKKMDQFDPDASFFHWACGVAFNEVRNFLTTQRRSRLHFDDELTSLIAAEAAEEQELSDARLAALSECMSKLSQRQQEILKRCYLSSDSITQIADKLGRERDALYKQLARLREKLQSCIRTRLAAESDR